MSRTVLSAVLATGLGLAALPALAEDTLTSGVTLSFSTEGVGSPGVLRPMPAPGRISVDYPVSRGAPASDLQLLPPVMQSRPRLSQDDGLSASSAPAQQPRNGRENRLQLDSYWSIGAFR